jgi:hypothetical protein
MTGQLSLMHWLYRGLRTQVFTRCFVISITLPVVYSSTAVAQILSSHEFSARACARQRLSLAAGVADDVIRQTT